MRRNIYAENALATAIIFTSVLGVVLDKYKVIVLAAAAGTAYLTTKLLHLIEDVGDTVTDDGLNEE